MDNMLFKQQKQSENGHSEGGPNNVADKETTVQCNLQPTMCMASSKT